MAEISLCDLGFTREELQEKLLEKLAAQVMSGTEYAENGEEYSVSSDFSRRLDIMVRNEIQAGIERVGRAYVQPLVSSQIASVVLAETNRWGERTKNETATFTEYIVKRSEEYMQTLVNPNGKTQSECGGYSSSDKFENTMTRMVYLVRLEINKQIQEAIQLIAKNFNRSLAESVGATVKAKLAEVQDGLTLVVAKPPVVK